MLLLLLRNQWKKNLFDFFFVGIYVQQCLGKWMWYSTNQCHRIVKFSLFIRLSFERMNTCEREREMLSKNHNNNIIIILTRINADEVNEKNRMKKEKKKLKAIMSKKSDERSSCRPVLFFFSSSSFSLSLVSTLRSKIKWWLTLIQIYFSKNSSKQRTKQINDEFERFALEYNNGLMIDYRHWNSRICQWIERKYSMEVFTGDSSSVIFVESSLDVGRDFESFNHQVV